MGIYRCLQAVAFDRPDGGGSVLSPNQIVDSNDPMFEGRQDLFQRDDLFEAFAPAGKSGVESATAAPGEKRTLPTRARRTEKEGRD